MKAPKFWKNKNIVSCLLYPLSQLYYFLYKLRVYINKKPYKSKIPVICIGNTVAGGAGKTPVAIALGKILNKNGKNFAYLSKGYGGKFEHFTKVDYEDNAADLVGDEPLLLSEVSDTFVCKSRVVGLKFLNKHLGYDYIIMDDGFQNPTFHKDKSILVVDGEYGLGNRCILPAGPLRETFLDSIKGSDLIVLIGQDKFFLEDELRDMGREVIRGSVREISKPALYKNKYVAFSGIGRPEKFFKSLKDVGLKVLLEISFGDHHNYTPKEIGKLFNKAEKLGCKLITTKKDWVRIDKKNRKKIKYLDIRMDFDKVEVIKKFLVGK